MALERDHIRVALQSMLDACDSIRKALVVKHTGHEWLECESVETSDSLLGSIAHWPHLASQSRQTGESFQELILAQHGEGIRNAMENLKAILDLSDHPDIRELEALEHRVSQALLSLPESPDGDETP